MSLATATVTYDLADMIGATYTDLRRTKVWVTTNVPGETVIDTVGNAIRLGDGVGSLSADGTGSVAVWVPGTGSNPTTWQTYIHVLYPARAAGVPNKTRDFGPFTITADADLADLVEEQEVPPDYLTTVTTLLDGYVTEAEAAAAAAAASADLAHDISGIATPDGVVATLVEDSGSDTAAALARVVGTGRVSLESFVTGDIDRTGATDYTAQITAALTALDAFGGGTLVLPSGLTRCAGQIVLPKGNQSTNGMWRMNPITIQGQGGHAAGQKVLGTGGSRLLLTYQGDGSSEDAAIVSYGEGQLVFDSLILQDTTAGSQTPFLYTTGTTVKVRATVAVIGPDSGTSCKKDFWVAGGTYKFPVAPAKTDAQNYGSVLAPFQGYGSSVVGAYFNQVRRVVYGRSYANQIIIRDNFFDKGCGSNLADGACIEFDASLTNVHPGDPCAANVIVGNYFENVGYVYGVKLTGGASNVIAFNGFEDQGAGFLAAVRLLGHVISATNYPSSGNSVIHNLVAQGSTVSADGMSSTEAANNLIISTLPQEGTTFPHKVNFMSDVIFPDVVLTRSVLFKDTSGNTMLTIGGSTRAWTINGPVVIAGNSAGAATTKLTIGNNSTADDAALLFRAPTGKTNQIQFSRNNVNSWLFYDANSTSWFFRDSVNAKMHLTFVPGAGAGGGSTDVNSALTVAGKTTLAASTTSKATANLPPGTAPAAPADGDMWTTTAGLFVRIAGVTVGPLS